jgi:UDP-GlcNAc:undecaprenyl-phosphate GlcNAc-1-phosphate transferase
MTVEGSVKTAVVVSFALPLILLAVPFLDTTFVLLKRVKYRRPVYRADSEHFHHRMARIGFSQRRTVLYFYAWTLMLAGLALAFRFVPYSDHHGHYRTGWSLLMIALCLLAGAASVYLVFVLEILKFKRAATVSLRRLQPDASEEQIAVSVMEDFETGEFELAREDGADGDGRPQPRAPVRARSGEPGRA